MQTAAFDTLATANALKEAGFEETQAAAIVDALRHAVTEEVATKANLSGLRTELKADLGELRAELKTDLSELRTELKTDLSELRADLYRALWMQAAGIIGLTVALLKIL